MAPLCGEMKWGGAHPRLTPRAGAIFHQRHGDVNLILLGGDM